MDKQVDTVNALNKVKGFKLLHLNVRSLVKKIEQVKIMFFNSCLDVITMSETWMTTAVSSKMVNLDDYIMYRQDRNYKAVGKKRGGGLVTYIHSRHAAECEVLQDISRSDRNIEAQWFIINRLNCKNVVICNMYRPPTGKLDKLIEYLDESIQLLDLAKVEVFVMGDLNVNYKNKVPNDYKKLNFFVKANGLTQIINNTTRNTDKSQSLIDLILTNSDYISMAGTLEHHISDHQPIFAVKKKKRDVRPKVKFEGRSYRNFDRDYMKQKLLDHDWGEFYKVKEPGEAWEYILQQVTPILDCMCPIRSFDIKNYWPDWVTPELLEQILDRDYFYKKAKQTKSEDDWNIAKHLRNMTNSNIRQARRDFVLTELADNCQDYKKFWKTIRTVIPNDKGDSKHEILLTHNGAKVPKDDVAQCINDYFINIGKVMGVPSQTIPTMQPPTEKREDDLNAWKFDDFTETEVFKVIKSINISKSSGINNISSFFLKEVFIVLTPQITHLFNLTVESSLFPDAWKDALVIPIPKCGNSKKVENYRPISLLPLPGKLLEKLVHNQLTTYLEDIEYLVKNQHGFRKGHSTIHSIAQLTNYVNLKMDKRQSTVAAFIDFRKAFDCVQHSILLGKLSDIGLDEGVVAWFRSYLSNRRQSVLANNFRSPCQKITQGVPQGSVLGPLFYIIYANDITKVVKNCNIALYADDTVLYLANTDFARTVCKVQTDMDALSLWCTENGIQMNVDKTKIMVFGNSKKIDKLPHFEIMVNNVPLQRALHYKYLGMTLDSQLNYNLHVQKIISNVTVKLKQFRRMRYFLDDKSALLIYKNMILPMIEYGDLFLVGTSIENKKKLQVLQNKGLRCALIREKDSNRDELHEEAKILRLKHRRNMHLLSYMYDVSHTEKHKLRHQKEGVQTRTQYKKLFKIRKPVTEKFKKSLAYRGPKRWNDLPEELHHLNTRCQFNYRVKSHIEKKAAGESLVERDGFP